MSCAPRPPPWPSPSRPLERVAIVPFDAFADGRLCAGLASMTADLDVAALLVAAEVRRKGGAATGTRVRSLRLRD